MGRLVGTSWRRSGGPTHSCHEPDLPRVSWEETSPRGNLTDTDAGPVLIVVAVVSGVLAWAVARRYPHDVPGSATAQPVTAAIRRSAEHHRGSGGGSGPAATPASRPGSCSPWPPRWSWAPCLDRGPRLPRARQRCAAPHRQRRRPVGPRARVRGLRRDRGRRHPARRDVVRDRRGPPGGRVRVAARLEPARRAVPRRRGRRGQAPDDGDQGTPPTARGRRSSRSPRRSAPRSRAVTRPPPPPSSPRRPWCLGGGGRPGRGPSSRGRRWRSP